jgi:hypothetical protein
LLDRHFKGLKLHHVLGGELVLHDLEVAPELVGEVSVAQTGKQPNVGCRVAWDIGVRVLKWMLLGKAEPILFLATCSASYADTKT